MPPARGRRDCDRRAVREVSLRGLPEGAGFNSHNIARLIPAEYAGRHAGRKPVPESPAFACISTVRAVCPGLNNFDCLHTLLEG